MGKLIIILRKTAIMTLGAFGVAAMATFDPGLVRIEPSTVTIDFGTSCP